jgi:hypothetical protein
MENGSQVCGLEAMHCNIPEVHETTKKYKRKVRHQAAKQIDSGCVQPERRKTEEAPAIKRLRHRFLQWGGLVRLGEGTEHGGEAWRDPWRRTER